MSVVEGRPTLALVALNYAPEPTGIGPFVAELAEYLRDADWNVDIVTSYPHYPSWVRSDDWVDHDRQSAVDGITIRRCRHRVPRRPRRVNRLLMELSFGIRSMLATPRDADMIVAVSPALFSTLAAVLRERLRRRERRRQVVIWVQDLYGRGLAQIAGRETLLSRMMAGIEGWVLRSASAVAVIHERIAEHLAADLGVAPDRVKVVRNWNRESWPHIVRDDALADLGWTDLTGSVIVVHAGSLGAKQQLENVVRAGCLAEQEDAKVVFVFVGDGACRRDLEALAGGVRSVRFVGLLDHEAFGHALSAADALLVNQSPEVADMCVPSKLLTYYAAQRPIVAAVSEKSIAADEVLGSGAGIVVAPGDPEALLQAVQGLGRDPARARSLGEAGGAAARSSFDRDRILGQFSGWLADHLPAERARPAGRNG